MEFRASHAADHDRFEILAFHDERAKTFAELDPKLVELKKDAWGGKDLPFPILLDATGKTVREYGISMFPTLLLVDPEGRLVPHGGEAMLALRLAEERPAVAERVKALTAPEAAGRRTLALLAAMGPADGEDGLAAAGVYLRSCSDAEGADAALDAMGRIGGGLATYLLEEAGMGSGDARRQERAASILGRTMSPGRLPSLVEYAGKEGASPALAKAVCEALSARAGENPDIRDVLRVACESRNAALAAEARAALARIQAR
jgi:hypothetical protein